MNRELPEVMKKSAYSADTKSDYIGALATRVKSLTNGINGQIFCSGQELSNEELFDRNVIVDISRVGAQETKALLMGILVMKLQEYRMSYGNMNRSLQHVTVLEEAHNLLRRTSDIQLQESANLQGKSVEMIANAIAEMRTYGEGFFIVDQAPGLLDSAVIRNTNTKIILRLPDETDRELVGKAASLNEEQIAELAKLKTGVAAVYQNEWTEAVLCQFSVYKNKKSYTYTQAEEDEQPNLGGFFTALLHGPEAAHLSKKEKDQLESWIRKQDIAKSLKDFLVGILWERCAFTEKELQYAVYCIAKGRTLVQCVQQAKDPDAFIADVEHRLMSRFRIEATMAREIRSQIFIYAAGQMKRGKDLMLQYGRIL